MDTNIQMSTSCQDGCHSQDGSQEKCHILQTFQLPSHEPLTEIKDKGHFRNWQQQLNEYRKSGTYTDVTLKVGPNEEPIAAHRLIITLDSQYFIGALQGNFKEANSKEILLKEIDVATMHVLLDWMYTGQIELSRENVEKIIRGAHYLRINTLVELCTAFIARRLDHMNCVEIMELGDLFSVDLKETAMAFFVKNFSEVGRKNLDLTEMNPDILLEIIEDVCTVIDQDPATNEERLFQLGWTNLQAKPDVLWNTFLPKLLKVVHLPQTSVDFMEGLVAKIGNCEEAKTLIEKGLDISKEIYNREAITDIPIITDDIRWATKRFRNLATLSIMCRIDKLESVPRWYGAPVMINGIAWCLNASIRMRESVKYFEMNAQCLEVLESQSVELDMRCKMKQEDYYEVQRSRHVQKLVNNQAGFGMLMKLDKLIQSSWAIDWHNVMPNKSCVFVSVEIEMAGKSRI